MSGSSSFADEVTVDPAHRPFFCVFAAVGVVLFYYSVGYARKYATVAAFLLPVRAAFLLPGALHAVVWGLTSDV